MLHTMQLVQSTRISLQAVYGFMCKMIGMWSVYYVVLWYFMPDCIPRKILNYIYIIMLC